MIHVSSIEPSHADSATIYVALDNHRENDFKPYLYVSNDWGKTWRSIASNLPTTRPGSVYVVREDLVNPNLLYCGTEIGVFASLNKGVSWFQLAANLPTVPVYDLQIHPRDHELIAGTHGEGRPDSRRRAAAADEGERALGQCLPVRADGGVHLCAACRRARSRALSGRGRVMAARAARRSQYRLASAARRPVRVLVVEHGR